MLSEIIEAGTACRLYELFAVSKLLWRILLDGLRIAPVRTITDLHLAAEIDGSESYRRLVNAAAALSATHGTDARRQLVALLRGSDFV